MKPTSEQLQAVTNDAAEWLQEYITPDFVHRVIVECSVFASVDDDTFDAAYEVLRVGKWTVAVTWEADDAE